jgi:hypothetical protein
MISANEAYSRWQEWVGEVSRSRISVGSILGESRLSEVRDGSVTIACPDDYHLASLKRNREFLVETFRTVTGCDVRIDPVLGLANGNPTKSLHRPHYSDGVITEQTPPASEEAIENHPVIVALRRELGAERAE